MSKRLTRLSRLILLMATLLAGCGGAPATATPLPASSVRPPQPAPVYPTGTAFTLLTPPPSQQITPAAAVFVTPALAPPESNGQFVAPTFLQPPPTALGIVRGGAALLAQPGGTVLQTLPVGTTVTLTGKSVDGAWLAAYLENGATGWIAATSLALFGADTLTIVAQSLGPGLAATLVAQAMQPLPMPTLVLTFTLTPP